VDTGHLRAWKTVGGHRRIDGASVDEFARDQGGKSSLSVMVVDDKPDDRDLVSTMVGTALPGAAIAIAPSGFEALMAIGQVMPDIVVIDLVMPHMNGFEMLRHLCTQRVVRPRLIVAVSSLPASDLAPLGELPPEVKFLPKPLEQARFIDLLRQVEQA
jgi:CheY-like chemotaxis protein